MKTVPIPQYFEFYRDVLDALADGQIHAISEMRSEIAKKRQMSEDDLAEVLPSGKQTVFANRVNWACSYLSKAQLLKRQSKGKYYLSEEGKKVQQDSRRSIDNDYLLQYPTFAEFVGKSETSGQKKENDTAEQTAIPVQTPEDTIISAFKTINSALADDLMSEIMNQTPDFFEKLVIDLLLKMGYGGPFEDSGIKTKSTGDGGIDGIIKEDKLGFSQIYIQAKRWDADKTVSRPEIQKFAGALLGEGASKGLFITTAKFSQGAIDFAERQHIVLVDGETLTQLMIEYNIGVSVAQTYSIKKIDSDFFNNQD